MNEPHARAARRLEEDELRQGLYGDGETAYAMDQILHVLCKTIYALVLI